MRARSHRPLAQGTPEPQAELPEGRGAWPKRPVRLLRLSADARVPPDCCCCGAPAASSVVEVSPRGLSLIVPYCTSCHAHATAPRTWTLSVVLASLLTSASVALALPLAFDWISVGAHLLVTLLSGLAPMAAWLLRRAAPEPGHRARGRAAFFVRGGELACLDPTWARDLARMNSLTTQAGALREPWFSARAAWVLLLPLAGALYLRELTFPSVLVLNLTEEPFEVTIDGRELGRVEPSSAESPAAGKVLRIPAGTRLARVTSATGRLVHEASLEVVAARDHLYAPGATEHCFWLETTGYGQHGPAETMVLPLDETRPFWVIPSAIDSWFAPNPDPSAEVRSTGGVMTALRQSLCRHAPSSVNR